MDGSEKYIHNPYSSMNLHMIPKGLEAIYNACMQLYPDQPNPLQVSARVKYWLGGPDPLDYISMYAHPGDPNQGVPPHWHFISFGLSDLHGDGRIHEPSGPDSPSGFGFELTLRLKREPGESKPPTWPACLMQSLARYVFQSENSLCVGDHIPWHRSLDSSASRIQHMVLVEDSQLPSITTPLGTVQFVQIVGVCGEELTVAQQWNGLGLAHLLQTTPTTGGPWLVLDMRRGETIFELEPSLQERVERGIQTEGSNLSGVTSHCSWTPATIPEEEKPVVNNHKNQISQQETDVIKSTLRRGLLNSHPIVPPIKAEPEPELDNSRLQPDPNWQQRSRKQSLDSNLSSSDAPIELLQTKMFEAVELCFNLEAAAFIPLALRGRLKHGRHFTFKGVMNDCAVTLVPPSVLGSIADPQHPYAAHGPWLQVLLTEDFIEQMCQDLHVLENPQQLTLPQSFCWKEHGLEISIIPNP